MSTSGTYEFASPQSKEIIEDAYERIGIISPQLDHTKIYAAQRSINFTLQSWINRGLNLWTVQTGMLALTPNQNTYNLPLYISDILEATIRTSTRNLGGTAFSSAGGVAANAFDNNPATACTQTAPNGNISYNWGALQYPIAMVGVQSNATLNYTLSFQYSNDNITWTTLSMAPIQSYPVGVIQWFVIPVPTLGNWFRVLETGGATLNVQELYFNTTLDDTIVTRMSRAEYIATPNKNNPARPTSFYVSRLINPTVAIWPTPTAQYNNLFYTYVLQMQDVGSMVDSAQIPARFLEALCATTAFKLGIKNPSIVDINKLNMLKALADEEYHIAAEEDRERVPLRIYGDYTQGWTSV
jgi:hypothetical protein